MRRDDEAFKNEVLRRYSVQKRNRRNYFLLALSPLVLAIVLGSLIFLPHLSGLFELNPAGTTTTSKEGEKNPHLDTTPVTLASKLANSPVESLTFMNPDFSQTSLSITDKEDINGLIQLMEGIKVTPCERYLLKASGITLTFRHQNGQSTEFILGDFAWCTGPSWWNEISENDLQIISDYVSSLMLKHLPSLKAPTPESYLHNDYTVIEIEQVDYVVSEQPLTQTVRDSELSALIAHLQTALKQASLITEKPPNHAPSFYWIEIYREKTHCVRMIVDRESNLLIVVIWEPEEAQNAYYFTFPEDAREDLCAYLNSLMNKEAPPITEPIDPPVTPPDPSEYIPENYTEVWVYNGTFGHRRSYTYTVPLLETLREKLASARISYDPIQHLESFRINIKADELSTVLLLDFDANMIIVSIQEDPNDYYFSLSDADMADILVAINNFIEEVNPNPITPPDPPKPPDPVVLPATLEECLKQTIKKVTVTIGVVGKTPTYTYTDKEAIDKLLSLIAEQELIPSASQDFPDFPDGLQLQYWINDQGKEKSYFTIYFDSSSLGKFECSVYDGKTYHKTVYDLPVDTIAAITEAAKPYYDPPPSDQTPLIKDLSDNAVLQGFLAAVGVTVYETPQDVPQEIKTLLTDYSYSSLSNGLFACDQSYTSPDEISLYALLYNYHDGHYLTDAERVALVQAGVHPDVVESISCGTFTEEEVRKLLADYLAYMPAFADDLHGALVEAGFVYLPETERFYYFHGDTNTTGPAENIRIYHTDRADTVIALYSYYSSPTALAVVAFRNTADGYKILGYTPL